MEEGFVSVSRASGSLIFPANFMLVASMNPCPCGYFGANIKGHECNCSISAVEKYRNRISGPLLDRFDIHIEVSSLGYEELKAYPSGEKSKIIKERVNLCRKKQIERYKNLDLFNNSQITPKLLREYCQIDAKSSFLLKNAMEKMGLSARAYDRILKVARTIADLENSENIKEYHIAEAIQYRSLDRKYW